MEEWQKRHIVANLEQLMMHTKCTPVLLAKLQTENLLSPFEVEKLSNATVEPLTHSRALYDLLKGRVNAYQILIQILLETNQSGAAKILQEGDVNSVDGELPKLIVDKSTVIGRGCQNTIVYQGKYGTTNVAVKVINCDYLPKDKAMKEVNHFKEFLEHANENIVRYYHLEKRSHFLHIALEYCDCNLAECVKLNKLKINEPDVLHQSAKGLRFLHEKGIIHMDLKPENILLKLEHAGNVVVKIADFGIAKKINEDDQTALTLQTSTGIGTYGWIAPEIQKKYEFGTGKKISADRGADIFSLGCIFYYVLSKGTHPFGDTLRVTANIADNKNIMKVSDFKDSGFIQFYWLIRLMINHIHIQRPSISSILQHPALWSPKVSIKFISEVNYLLRNNIGSTHACMARCTQFLSEVGSAAPVISNKWLELLCPNILKYVCSEIIPKTTHITCPTQVLIVSITQLYDEYGTKLPTNVKEALGQMPTQFLLYWTTRFPFLISSLWTHFEEMKDQSMLTAYYTGFHFSFNSPQAKLAITEAFGNPGKGTTFHKEVRVESSPLQAIPEAESPSENITPTVKLVRTISEKTIQLSLPTEPIELECEPDIPNLDTMTLPPAEAPVETASDSQPPPMAPIPRTIPEDSSQLSFNNPDPTSSAVAAILANDPTTMNHLDLACQILEQAEKKPITEISKILQNNFTGTLLHFAVYHGSHNAVQHLLNNQNFSKALNDDRMHDILHFCVKDTFKADPHLIQLKQQIIEMLLSLNGGLINRKNYLNETPLHVQPIHVDLLICLINHSGNLASIGLQGKSSMHVAPFSCASGHDYHKLVEAVITQNLENKNVFQMRCSTGKLPLHYAVMQIEVSLDTLELLENLGVLDVNARDRDNTSIFLQAIMGLRTVEFLNMLCTKFHAVKKITDIEQKSALHNAAMYGHLSAVKYLISECPDFLSMVDSWGRTPLHCAFLRYHDNWLNVTQALVSNKVEVNAKTGKLNRCRTALHIFIESVAKYKETLNAQPTNYFVEVVKYLIEKGADPTLTDSDGNSAFHTVFEYGTVDMISYMCSLDIFQTDKFEMRNGIGDSPLHKLFKRKEDAKLSVKDVLTLIQVIQQVVTPSVLRKMDIANDEKRRPSELAKLAKFKDALDEDINQVVLLVNQLFV